VQWHSLSDFSSAPALAAAGLEPGVHADPGSPAAKQYELPLNQLYGQRDLEAPA
jgi:hypothetical protein